MLRTDVALPPGTGMGVARGAGRILAEPRLIVHGYVLPVAIATDDDHLVLDQKGP